MPRHLLTLRIKETRTELWYCPPESSFPGFGGSSTGLLVGKTPSLVTRRISPEGQFDVEWDVYHAHIWETITKAINGDLEVTATRESHNAE